MIWDVIRVLNATKYSSSLVKKKNTHFLKMKSIAELYSSKKQKKNERKMKEKKNITLYTEGKKQFDGFLLYDCFTIIYLGQRERKTNFI